MPTYEYHCKACNALSEVVQSIKDDPLRVCPVCQENALERLISGGNALLFKGDGFYITDYKKGKGDNNK